MKPTRKGDILSLARSFPALQNAPGARLTWNPGELDAWACSAIPSSGAIHAARFVLSVFNVFTRWQCGPFEVAKAVGVWDSGNLGAFQAWAKDPWLA
jgi:hypothetical protein